MSIKRPRDPLTGDAGPPTVLRKVSSSQSVSSIQPRIATGPGGGRPGLAPSKFSAARRPNAPGVPLQTITNNVRRPMHATVRHPAPLQRPTAPRRPPLPPPPRPVPVGNPLRKAELARSRLEAEVARLKTQIQEEAQSQAAEKERHQTEAKALQDLVAAKDVKIESCEALIVQRDATIADQEDQLKARGVRIAELEAEVETGERQRKKLHNEVQELKGNIRVIARVRGNGTGALAFSLPDQGRQGERRAIEVRSGASPQRAGEKDQALNFTFDRVFGPEAQQAEVFEEISQVVQSALDGYKVTIFAYGQTGSGKTYTMEGLTAAPEHEGMIPRAVAQIFQEAERLRPRGWEFHLEASFLEIYNEDLRDLLGSPASYERKAGVNPTTGANTFERESSKHEIHHGPGGNTTVSNLSSVTIRDPSDVTALLRTAASNRSTAATKMNARSSRSHSLFMLRLTGRNAGMDQTTTGVLNLIDLAGSERIKESGATGDRMKEAKSINKSLSSLSDVVAALATKKAHVPYRNSKLTYLLQNYLGGDGKILMFLTLSPETDHLQESTCSLRFAAKVNSVVVGTAKRKVS